MIKDPDNYRKESEKERREYLRSLTLEHSAKIVEELVTSELGREILRVRKEWGKNLR